MDPSVRQKKRIDELFDAVLDLPPAERGEFLDRECVAEPELRPKLDRLLEAMEEDDEEDLVPGGALQGVLIDALVVDQDWLGPGQNIGPYKLIRELGRGGMAEVYLASRDEQQVAIKVLRPGYVSREILHRFEQERRILGSLDHPNIARLLDGGMTPDNRPYLVMEYIDGLPIDEYCDRNQLTVGQRLRLFIEVGRAVEHAHRNLLVHRDLKPANIFVTSNGGVRLLDFGIAKLLDPQASMTMLTTRTDYRWLTPEYASPEQILGIPLTTASDQFQLGILLYQLLTGERPHRRDVNSTASGSELAWLEQTPRRPSTLVARAERGVGVARGTTREQLSRRLRGDLDVIILTALRKEPQRRYPSVELMVRDIEQHLVGLPLQAQEDTFVYRLSRFVTRHRVGVMVAAFASLMILVYAITLTLQHRQITRERDRARAEAAKAQEVKAFLGSLFEAADPLLNDGEEITARQLLDRGRDRIEEGLTEQPEVLSEMMHLLGRTYFRLGDFEAAEPLLARALELRRPILGPDHAELAQNLNDLANALRGRGDYDEAEARHREALEMRRRVLGQQHSKVSGSLHNLASVLELRGELVEAEALYREALEMDRAIQGSDLSRDVSFDLNSLGQLLGKRGQLEEAESLFQQALAIRRQLLGPAHPAVASSLRQLAIVRVKQGVPERAAPLAEIAMEICQRVYGAEHTEIADSMVVLARVDLALGELDSAEQRYKEALRLYDKRLRATHRDTALATAGLGFVAQERGDHSAAIVHLEKAAAALDQQSSRRHPDFAEVYQALGRSLAISGEQGQAAWRLKQAYDLRQQLFGATHERTEEVRKELERLTNGR